MNSITRALSQVGLALAKYSPTIALAAGIGFIMVGTVVACKRTLKLDPVLKKTEEEMNEIKEKVEEQQKTGDATYNAQTLRRDKGIVVAKTVGRMAKHYWPAIVLLTVGIALCITSHAIMARRYAVLSSAYASLMTAYQSQMNAERKIVDDGKGGQTVQEIPQQPLVDYKGRSLPGPYCAWLDDDSFKYDRDSLTNTTYNIVQIQHQCQRMYDRYGYLYLNQVFKLLDLPPTDTGAIVGWTKDGAGTVDFGIDDYLNFTTQTYIDVENAMKNGEKPPILLDFNCDGLIYGNLPVFEGSKLNSGKTYPNPAATLEYDLTPEEYDNIIREEMGEV